MLFLSIVLRDFTIDRLLQDILQNKDIHLDGILIASLVFDLLKVSLQSSHLRLRLHQTW